MPKRSHSFLHRGLTLHRAGDVTAATLAYRRHLADYPSDQFGYYHLAIALEAVQQTEDALHCYAKAVELDPYYPEALNNLGILFHSQNNLDAARLCFARALAARPGYVDAEYNYATAESTLGNYQNALLHFSQLLERVPDHANAWNNLGNVFLALAEPAEALSAFEFALRLRADLPEARWNAAAAELTLGYLPQGWAGFDHRGPQRHASVPRWQGERLTGKRLLIHAEQGLGDTIQFSRYCSQVTADYIWVECQPELIPLLRQLPGITDLFPFGSDLPPSDHQIPLMSLPGLFQTTLSTIPGPHPYLRADPKLIANWKQRMAAPGHSLKVGLVWSGNPKHRNDRNRSLDPGLLKPLSQVKDAVFYCLQQKPLSAVANDLHPLRFAGIFDQLTFPDTAAIMANLDLVISVDTAAAHLAGALGRPVWTLLPFAPDWRWMLERPDSPWYPTMRLFRQPRRNDWPAVIEQVAGKLRQLVHQMV